MKMGINCTVVELKHYYVGGTQLEFLSINCTVVELKLKTLTIILCLFEVLIVPLWN